MKKNESGKLYIDFIATYSGRSANSRISLLRYCRHSFISFDVTLGEITF